MTQEWIWFVTIAVALGAFALWPRVGLLARLGQMRALQQRAQVEDALKHLHTCEWRGNSATLDSLCGALHLSDAAAVRLASQMEAQGLMHLAADGLRLTPEGERMAVAIIRAHRLWERYLADEARMPLTAIHAEAERREHVHNPAALEALEVALGYPATDPHGDPIPTASGELTRRGSKPLAGWPLHTPARIVHLEDEPPALFAQLAAMGLRPGQIVQVLEANEQRVILSDGEATHSLAPIVAANIFVVPDGAPSPAHLKRLSTLKPGQQATVQALTEALQGFTRRRLLDLGLTPGTRITVELPSMFRDPVAYRVRGTLIALRREQAEHILITIPE